MELSIEDAWAALINRPLMRRLATRDAAYGNRSVPAIKGAARALALAVLEEARETVAYDCGKFLAGGQGTRTDELGAQIEALGKEG